MSGVFTMRYGLMTLMLLALMPVVAMGQMTEMEPGYVLQAEGRLVFIDKGQGEVEPDDLFQIVRQENIIHPVTGENLGGQVPLGVVRIVQVFNRLSTAEVVNLVKGMDIEALDWEAKQGMIRTHPLAQEVATEVREQIVSKETGRIAPPGKLNPDGIVGKTTPHLRVGLGSRPGLDLPVRIIQLIPATLTVGDLGTKPVDFVADGAYAFYADTLLTSLADAGADSVLQPFGAAFDIFLTLDFPRRPWYSMTVDIGIGSRSQLAVGARFYPGKRLGFLGDGYTPAGLVGEPVVTFKVGWGGRGARNLPVGVQSLLKARIGLQADDTFKAAQDAAAQPADQPADQGAGVVLPADQEAAAQEAAAAQVAANAVADTLFRTGITQMLRGAATDSLRGISTRSTGFIFGLTLPLTTRFTLRGGLTQLGNIKEYSGGLTYYMKKVEAGAEGTNPDGALRSFIVSLDGAYDTGLSQSSFQLDVTYPVSMHYTISAGFLSDFSEYSRFGFSLRGYF